MGARRGRQQSRSSAPRSRAGSPSSTPPTCTRRRRARSRPAGCCAKFLTREEVVIATKVFMPMTPGENGGGLSRKHILPAIDASLKRLGIDYVDLYQIHRWDPARRSRRRWRRCTTSCARARPATSARARMFAWQFAKAQHVGRAPRLDAVRLDAEPLQPALPRGGAGDDPPLPRPGRRRDPVEPARARRAGRQPHARRRAAHDPRRTPTRSPTTSTSQPTDFDVVDARRRGRRRARRPAGTGGARLAAAQARA